MPETTPRPWHIRHGAEEGEYHICAPGVTIAVCDARPSHECEANARLIVQAVNSFEELVAACKEAIAAYDAAYETGKGNWSEDAVKRMRAALQKAGRS